MIRINSELNEYDVDIRKIVMAFAIELKEIISEWQAYKMWKEYSYSVACSWCSVPKSYTEIVNELSPYFEVVQYE